MDKLEDFIRKNREELDSYSPSPDVWEKVNREMGNKRPSFKKWLSVAAFFAIALSTAVFFYTTGRLESTNNQSGEEVSGTYNDIPQLKETEIYYNNLVNSLYTEATPLLTGNPEVKNELNSDINQLDSICTDIKKDLKDNVANKEVVEALIQNYRIKIKLLEDMLTILKENEDSKEKNKSHEL
jgi:hypothetical protein